MAFLDNIRAALRNNQAVNRAEDADDPATYMAMRDMAAKQQAMQAYQAAQANRQVIPPVQQPVAPRIPPPVVPAPRVAPPVRKPVIPPTPAPALIEPVKADGSVPVIAGNDQAGVPVLNEVIPPAPAPTPMIPGQPIVMPFLKQHMNPIPRPDAPGAPPVKPITYNEVIKNNAKKNSDAYRKGTGWESLKNYVMNPSG